MYSIILAAASAALSPTAQNDGAQAVYFQQAEVEIKTFTGVLKVRQRTPEQKAFYLEFNDGSVVHISTNVDEITLEPFVNKEVKIHARLREKTTHSNDFIRQVYTIEKTETSI